MTIEKAKERLVTDFESKGFKLLEKVVDEFNESGVEPDAIEYLLDCSDDKIVKIGDLKLFVKTTARHNGTRENVTVTIDINEVTDVISNTCYSMKRIERIKVPKDASDKVIKNRVNKAIEILKAGI